MNERIRELAEKAGLAQPADVRAGYIYPEGMEKFAELIVQECCDMVNKHHQWNNPNDCLLVLGIKEHFGIDV